MAKEKLQKRALARSVMTGFSPFGAAHFAGAPSKLCMYAYLTIECRRSYQNPSYHKKKRTLHHEFVLAHRLPALGTRMRCTHNCVSYVVVTKQPQCKIATFSLITLSSILNHMGKSCFAFNSSLQDVMPCRDSHDNLSAFDLANSYNSRACQAAIVRTKSYFWPLLTGNQVEIVESGQIKPVNITGKGLGSVVYVRNQKVASMMLFGKDGVVDILGLRRDEAKINKSKMPFIWNEQNNSTYLAPHSYSPNKFMFTVVREPLHKFVSGYIEVSLRNGYYGGKRGGFWKKPCGQARFKLFVQELLSHKHLTKDVFHAWPQALLINVGRLDAIARLERFASDAATLRQAVHNGESVRLTTDAQLLLSVPSHKHRSHPCSKVNLSRPDVMRKLCPAIEVDYICFPYPPPDICCKLFPDFAASSIGCGLRNR